MNSVVVFISGSSGYIGKSLCQHLSNLDITVIPVTRTDLLNPSKFSPTHSTPSVYINLAGRAHEDKASGYDLYAQDNIETVRNGIRICSNLGISKFIHLSTIKVYGEQSNCIISLNEACTPQSSYGITKMLAEAAALEGCRLQNIDLEILRIPLIVSTDAKGNIAAIVKLITKRLPIPFGQFRAKRTMLQKSALIETIATMCKNISAPSGKAHLHLLGDPEPMSTAELTQHLAIQLQIEAKVFSIPLFLFKLAAFVGDKLEALGFKFPLSSAKLDKLNSSLILIPGSKKIETLADLGHTKVN